MIKQALILALISVATLSVVHADPQSMSDGAKHDGQKGHKGHGGHKMPAFADIDADNDGRVSRAEFNEFRGARIRARAEQGGKMKNLANAPSFDDVDSDSDGSIDEQELETHQAKQRAKKQQQKMKKHDQT